MLSCSINVKQWACSLLHSGDIPLIKSFSCRSRNWRRTWWRAAAFCSCLVYSSPPPLLVLYLSLSIRCAYPVMLSDVTGCFRHTQLMIRIQNKAACSPFPPTSASWPDEMLQLTRLAHHQSLQHQHPSQIETTTVPNPPSLCLEWSLGNRPFQTGKHKAEKMIEATCAINFSWLVSIASLPQCYLEASHLSAEETLQNWTQFIPRSGTASSLLLWQRRQKLKVLFRKLSLS